MNFKLKSNNSTNDKLYLKINRIKNWFKLFLVFTFFVHSAISADLFPEQLKQPVVHGTLIDDNISILFRTKQPITVFQENNPVLLPQNTFFEVKSPMDSVLAAYNPESTQDDDDNFIRDLISRVSIMNYFSEMEQQQNKEDSPSSERKSKKERIKIVKSMEKKLEETEMVVTMDSKDFEKVETLEQDGLPIVLDSDFDGRKDWDPESYEVVESKTEGKVPKYCKKCKVYKENDVSKPAKEIVDQTAAAKINSLFEKNVSPSEKQYNQKIQNALSYAMKKRAKSSTGYCYRYVKNALFQSGITFPRLNGAYAKNASTQLEIQGFKNLLNPEHLQNSKLKNENMKDLLKNPNLAPKGAILVYEPNPANRAVRVCKNVKGSKKCFWDQDAGHIEIKTKESGLGGYVSDYYNEKARTGKAMVTADRKLVGIYYKL